MHKIRDGPYEEVRFRLEIRIKHGDKVTLLNIVIQHPLLQCASLVPFPIVPHLIFHVFTFVSPKLALKLHQILLRTHIISDIVFEDGGTRKIQ